jgi:hypothetical protein
VALQRQGRAEQHRAVVRARLQAARVEQAIAAVVVAG